METDDGSRRIFTGRKNRFDLTRHRNAIALELDGDHSARWNVGEGLREVVDDRDVDIVDLLEHILRIEQRIGGAVLHALGARCVGLETEQVVDDDIAGFEADVVPGSLEGNIHRVVFGAAHLLSTGLDQLIIGLSAGMRVAVAV